LVGLLPELLKVDASSNLVNAAAGTDYLAPAAIGSTVQGYNASLTALAADPTIYQATNASLTALADNPTIYQATNASLTALADNPTIYQATNASLTALAADPTIYQATNANLTALADNPTIYQATNANLTALAADPTIYQATNANLTAWAGLTPSGTVTVGTIQATNTVALSYATASLPAAPSTGTMVYVTDCLTPDGTGGMAVFDGTKYRVLPWGFLPTTSFYRHATNCNALGLSFRGAMEEAFFSDSGSLASWYDATGTVSGTGANRYSMSNTGTTEDWLEETTGTTTTGYAWQYDNAYWPTNYTRWSCWRISMVSGLSDATDRYWTYAGSSDTFNGLGTFLAGFVYDPALTLTNNVSPGSLSNNLVCVSAAGGTKTWVNSGVAMPTLPNWVTVGVLTAANNAASVEFYVNGTAIVTNSTTPGWTVVRKVGITKTAGSTARKLATDWTFHIYRRDATRSLYP
jgi:CTP:molybdopterin cytidylyltransferase MocA